MRSVWRRAKQPTNVFVLGTGRCGTVTFIRACEHFDNYTAGHESRSHFIGPDRFAYPSGHIEADNRLSWFLGGLGSSMPDREVLFVHLRRDADAVAASFLRRWDSKLRASIIRAFAHGIVMQGKDWDDPERVCRFYVDTVTANIEEFIHSRPSMTIWLEEAQERFPQFVDRVHAAGDVDGALAEWGTKHNASV